MDDFYKNRYNFYRYSYWDSQQNDLLKPNGFTQYPHKEYDYFVNVIDSLNNKVECRIMDICCGNGLLLRHLTECCHSQIIPFGIDFLELSIEQAVRTIHPNYSQNFFLSNAIDFDFTQSVFDFVLLDPYHFIDNDLVKLLQILIKRTTNSIIFYTYTDVLTYNDLRSVAEFSALKNVNDLKMFNYNEVSIAVLCVT